LMPECDRTSIGARCVTAAAVIAQRAEARIRLVGRRAHRLEYITAA
jgi:hypothetical protein